MSITARLGLPYLQAAQAQKHVTMNESLARLDALVQASVLSATETEPPASPAEGDCYILPAGATGAWAGHDAELALYDAGAWAFLLPQTGWIAHVEDQDALWRYLAGWAPLRFGPALVPQANGDIGIGIETPQNRVHVHNPSGNGAAALLMNNGGSGATASDGLWFGYSNQVWFWNYEATDMSFATGNATQVTIKANGKTGLGTIDPQERLHVVGNAILAESPEAARTGQYILEEEVSLSGASVQTAIQIPDRAFVYGVTTRTTSAITGAASYECGIAGEPDKYGGSLSIAAGASNSGITGGQAFYADTPIRLTAQGGSFTGGAVRVAIHYLRLTPPQS